MTCGCNNKSNNNTPDKTGTMNGGVTEPTKVSNKNFRSFLEHVSNTVTLYDNTIVSNMTGSNSLMITNISETSLTNIPLPSPSSVYNAEIELTGVMVQLNSNINRISITGYKEFLSQAVENANLEAVTSSNSSSNIVPFQSLNLYGNGVGVNNLADYLSSYDIFGQSTLGYVKTYSLMLSGKTLTA